MHHYQNPPHQHDMTEIEIQKEALQRLKPPAHHQLLYKLQARDVGAHLKATFLPDR
jgi:hypothetical protein